MKILHLLGERVDVGGVLTVIRNLQQATRAYGCRHTVWVNQTFREMRRPSLQYCYSRHMCADVPSHGEILFRALRGLCELRQLLQRERYDLLHGHSRCALLVGLGAARWLGRKFLFTNHTYARRIGLYRWAARQNGCHTVILTPNMARHYRLEVRPPKVNVISACCSDEFLAEGTVARAESPATRLPLQLIGVGNIVRWKNWHLLLEALMELSEEERRQVQFVHFGLPPDDGDSMRYADELRQFVQTRRLEKQVRFGGLTLAVQESLRRADWFVLPSTNEPCSVALIEALALGLPALVSASGGNLDIIWPGKTGLLFEPGSRMDLAAKLRAILHSSVAVLPPRQVRESVRSRSASAIGLEYYHLYRQLLAPPARHPISNRGAAGFT
ncbi:MAG: glycosyltransferase [Chloroflexi bacterium]|nr:glycosyltransferase [Chloroflexota bacterium]